MFQYAAIGYRAPDVFISGMIFIGDAEYVFVAPHFKCLYFSSGVSCIDSHAYRIVAMTSELRSLFLCLLVLF